MIEKVNTKNNNVCAVIAVTIFDGELEVVRVARPDCQSETSLSFSVMTAPCPTVIGPSCPCLSFYLVMLGDLS